MRGPLAVAVCLAAGVLARGATAGEPTAAARAEARAIEADLVQAVRRVRAATVSILAKGNAARTDPAAASQPLSAVGSGVVVRYRGLWVLTSLHVVDSEARLEAVSVDGRRHEITLALRDVAADLALLAFTRPPQGVAAVPLEGRRVARADLGGWVLATGNPFFLALDGDGVATLGIVSGLRPSGEGSYIDVPTTQHDAEINPGSSGGPLWTAHGELLGINGTIATRSRAQGAGPAYTGASFAVPMDRIHRFLVQALGAPQPERGVALAPRGENVSPPPVVRPTGFLGIRYRSEVDAGGLPSGARVTGVIAPSPVAASPDTARIQPGDVITGFAADGRAWRIRSAQDVQGVLSTLPPGTTVTLRFVRSGRVLGWTGQLGTR